MDDAPLLGIEGAQRKAYTALLGIGTQTFFERVKDNLGALHGLSHFKRSTMVGGGLPVILDDMIVGGIGVGGGSVEEDIACAQAGIDALRGD